MATTDPTHTGTGQVLLADAAMAGVILLLGSVLAVTGNSLVQRWQGSAGLQQSVSFEDQLGITANVAGLVVIAWWAGSFLAAVAAALLERAGRTRAASAAARFSPGFMRRLALAGVGLQLITAPLATAAGPAALPGTGQSAGTALSVAWTPPPGAAKAAGQHPGGTVPATLPVPVPVPVAGTSTTGPQWKPLHPVVEPGHLASRQLRPPEPAATPGDVTVCAGDSLWSISSSRLGPLASDVDIATAWPRLYQANRQAIGENPDVLLPGQVLRIPPGM